MGWGGVWWACGVGLGGLGGDSKVVANPSCKEGFVFVFPVYPNKILEFGNSHCKRHTRSLSIFF